MSNYPPKIQFEWGNFLGGGLLLFAAGFFFIWRGISVIGFGLNQIGWIETTAVVTESEIRRTFKDDRTEFNYDFQYEYMVDDEAFRSRRYSAAQLSPSESEGVDQYIVGDEISIFYNPDDPKEAVVVIKRPSIFVYLGIILGGIFLAMAIGLTFYGDVGSLADVAMAKQEARYLKFGKTYLQRVDVPLETIISEINKTMPHSLYRTLTKFIKNDNKRYGVTYLGNKTGFPTLLCKKIINEIEKEMAN